MGWRLTSAFQEGPEGERIEGLVIILDESESREEVEGKLNDQTWGGIIQELRETCLEGPSMW